MLHDGLDETAQIKPRIVIIADATKLVYCRFKNQR